MDIEHVRGEVAAVNDLLHKCWLDAIKLEAGRAAWRQLRPALEGYSNAAPVLWGWYRDATLAGCRRLLDDNRSRDTVSVVRALRRLKKVAPHVTVDLLLEVWVSSRPNRTTDRMAIDVQDAMSTVVIGDRDGSASVLTRAAVDRDLARLRQAHADVITFVDRTVAHRVDGELPTIGETDLSALLDDVLEVARRWVALVDGAELMAEAPHYTGFNALARAAELFDWREYVEAVWEEKARVLGPFAPPEAYDELEARTRIRFVWPEDADG